MSDNFCNSVWVLFVFSVEVLRFWAWRAWELLIWARQSLLSLLMIRCALQIKQTAILCNPHKCNIIKGHCMLVPSQCQRICKKEKGKQSKWMQIDLAVIMPLPVLAADIRPQNCLLEVSSTPFSVWRNQQEKCLILPLFGSPEPDNSGGGGEGGGDK